MGGASGAHVSVYPECAMKTADEGPVRERLRAQYRWLHAHREMNSLVRVFNWDENGYNMERLDEWKQPFNPIRLGNPVSVLWSRTAEVELDFDAHVEWLVTKITTAKLDIMGTYDSVNYVRHRTQHLRTCLTHGDLTRANVMRRDNVSVLIDPIPATPACADIWVFDLSTVVISLLGFEHVVYGWERPTNADLGLIERLVMRCNPVEFECLRYMTVVQIARRLPYFPEEVHDGLIGIARQGIRLRP